MLTLQKSTMKWRNTCLFIFLLYNMYITRYMPWKKNTNFHYFVVVEKTNPFLATTMFERKKYKYQSKNFHRHLIPGFIPFSSGSVSSYSTNLLKDGCFWLRSFWQMFDRYSHQKGTFRHLSWFLNELVRFEAEGWTKWLVHTFLRIFWSVKNLLFPPFYF